MLPVSDTAIDQTIVATESGIMDATMVLEHLQQHISKIKEEASSRKERYNRDDNRYNAGRGAHLTLKHGEKAHNLVNKLLCSLSLKLTVSSLHLLQWNLELPLQKRTITQS